MWTIGYFLMKGLEGDADANNDRKITNGELHSYVRSNVTRQAKIGENKLLSYKVMKIKF